ncbi:MAG: diacylglycerol kinase family protein [Bacteroidota bacterium]
METQTLAKAFQHAFNGLFQFVKKDRNGKLHLLACCLVIAGGFFFKISSFEWMIVLLCFALVISLEMCNHALEKLADAVHEAHHPLIKTAKDVAAAAVLWSAIIAAIIGALIFLPKIVILL